MKTYINGKQQIAVAGSRSPVPIFPASEVMTLVGTTPVPKYATWDAHRHEMRRSAGAARQLALARRAA